MGLVGAARVRGRLKVVSSRDSHQRAAAPPAASARVYFVYVLRCERGAWYVGKSYHWARCFIQHREGRTFYTRVYPPLGIAYTRLCQSEGEALFYECVLTQLLQRLTMKVGGAYYTWPSLSGQGVRRPFLSLDLE